MDEFTEQERHQIDDMHRRNLEGLSADEVKLLMRWNAAVALQQDEYQQEQKRRDEYLKERIKQSQAETDAAIDRLQALKEKALARLERG